MSMSPPTAFPSAFLRCVPASNRKSAFRPSTSADTASPPRCGLHGAGPERCTAAARDPALRRRLRRPRPSRFGRCRGDHGPAQRQSALPRSRSSPRIPSSPSRAADSPPSKPARRSRPTWFWLAPSAPCPCTIRLRAEMIRVADGTQVWVEDLLVDRNRVAGLETELVNRLVFRLAAPAPISKQRYSGNRIDSSGFREPSPPRSSPERSLVHLGRRRPGKRQQPPAAAKPTRSSSALIMNGRPWSATACRMDCSICLRATELDPSLIEARVDLVESLRRAGLLRLHVPRRCGRYCASHRRLRSPTSSVRAEADSARARLGPVPCGPRSAGGALRLLALRPSAPRPVDHPRPLHVRAQPPPLWRSHRSAPRRHSARSLCPVAPCPPRLGAAPCRQRQQQASTRSASTLRQFPEHAGANLYGAIILAFNGEAARAASARRRHSRSGSPTSISRPRSTPMLWPVPGRADEARAILERLQWLGRERFLLRAFTPGRLPGPGRSRCRARRTPHSPTRSAARGSSRCSPIRASSPSRTGRSSFRCAPSSTAWKLNRQAPASHNRTLILPAHPSKCPPFGRSLLVNQVTRQPRHAGVHFGSLHQEIKIYAR